MADSNGSSWSIVSQREDIDRDVSGEYVQGVKVTFRTGKGQTGSVFVSRQDHVPAVVRARVAAAAARMDDIADLAG